MHGVEVGAVSVSRHIGHCKTLQSMAIVAAICALSPIQASGFGAKMLLTGVLTMSKKKTKD